MNYRYLFLFSAIALAGHSQAGRLLHLPMVADRYGELSDEVTGRYLQVYGRHINENIPGAVGEALRFDGYSTYAQGLIDDLGDRSQLTISMWVAPETYPVVAFDTPTDDMIRLAGTLDEDGKCGWEFGMGYTGKYAFRTYSGGWPVVIEAGDLLPCYEWSHLAAVIDGATRTATLYRNGVAVGSGRIMDTVSAGGRNMSVGKAPGAVTGDFSIDTFNGLIDDIEIYDTAMTSGELAGINPENEADLTIPVERYEGDLWRPLFHGMPGAGWTNETHGMTFYNGRYHLFFQKNANGPFMTRLHWGHLTSENLTDWREERIAIAPGEEYDIKGCWSGCVFADDELTAGRPSALYTAVDYRKASIAQADPADDDLSVWNKAVNNPLIGGRPSGLSDDFRDPYFFRNGDDAFIIVGTSKDNVGAATLHKYDRSTGQWSSDGRLFFRGSSAATDGRFWEMPTVTRLNDGKWLVTVTPLDTDRGVHTLYWTGTISAEGTFEPDAESSASRDFELISRDGYGLLSPTICQHEGMTIALGIVPDKVSTAENCQWGWAHLYSFPREISLDGAGNLIQKPFEGLRKLRSSDHNLVRTDVTVSGHETLTGVSGRQIELYGRFRVGTSPFGFSFFENASGRATLMFTPAINELRVDLSGLNRLVNDAGVYSGVYSAVLPASVTQGTVMTLDLFIDGSVIDIFVNDRWATSLRAYPSDDDAVGIGVFSTGGDTAAEYIGAWQLKSNGSSALDFIGEDHTGDPHGTVTVFNLMGQKVGEAVSGTDALEGLERGIYIVGSRKVIVR